MSDNFLWCEKYRPRTISETVLPKKLKKPFEGIIETGEVPNMLLTGTSGLGKTTVARAICNELDLDYILINGSDERNIDTLRNKIRTFASTISLSGGYKVVIIDEADYLNPQSTQPALRGFIEEFSSNCRFILTCNYRNRIIKEIHSRCKPIEFNTSKKDLAILSSQFFVLLKKILADENVVATDEVLIELIKRFAPDWRRVLMECQTYGMTGEISLDDLTRGSDEQYEELFRALKGKEFKKMRQWVTTNVDLDANAIFRGVYDRAAVHLSPESVPQLILILAEYQYKQSFVADSEINFTACFIEVMANCEFV